MIFKHSLISMDLSYLKRVQVPSLAPKNSLHFVWAVFSVYGTWTREGFGVKKTIRWIVFSRKREGGTARKAWGDPSEQYAVCSAADGQVPSLAPDWVWTQFAFRLFLFGKFCCTRRKSHPPHISESSLHFVWAVFSVYGTWTWEGFG